MSDVAVDSSEIRRVVIVGAGHGGGTAAAMLRQQGFGGEIVLIGAEPVGPYHRPPLSKSLLKGELQQPLQPKEFYADQGIDLRTSTRVEAIDRDARAVRVTGGGAGAVDYDVLILATGARARPLPVPGVDLEKVYELRTITHARILHDVLSPGRHLAIVGGGWIGLEVAASARSADVEVTVIEREERLLARVASEELSRHLTDYHETRGTRLMTSAQVTALEAGERGIVGSVVLADGRRIGCDRVLVGIGAVAEDGLASGAQLTCEDGVVVDSQARTSDPRVYAVGDMTRRPLMSHDGLFRLESIPSAVEQARQAVASILSKPAPAPEVPWFWSDQFDLKLQIAGLLRDTDTATVRADPAANRLAVFHTRAGRLVAVEAVNAPAEFMVGKHLIREQAELDLDAVADALIPVDRLAVGTAAAAKPQTTRAGAGEAAMDIPGPSGKVGEPRVTYIQHDGELHSVEVATGLTVMDGSVRNNLPGIIAECGGMCTCGTCHVYVDPAWQDRLEDPELEEEDLLEFIEGRQPNSRLSCQIVLSDELDGLVVRVPEFEG